MSVFLGFVWVQCVLAQNIVDNGLNKQSTKISLFGFIQVRLLLKSKSYILRELRGKSIV